MGDKEGSGKKESQVAQGGEWKGMKLPSTRIFRGRAPGSWAFTAEPWH